MFINIVGERSSIAKLYAMDLEKKLKEDGNITTFIRNSHQSESAYLASIEKVMGFGQAILLTNNFEELMKSRETPLPDAHILVVNGKDKQMVEALKAKVQAIEEKYANSGKPFVMSVVDVYNRFDIPRQDISTTNNLASRVRRLKQT